MKRSIIILITFLTTSLTSYTQKQEQNDVLVELEFAPLGASPLKITNLKARYFKSDDLSFRLGLFLGGSSSPVYSKPNSIELISKTSNFNFNFRPGIEKHFEGTDKLSPYVGGEMSFAFNRDVSSTQSPWAMDTLQIKTQKNTDSKSTIGLNIFTGADIYLTDKIFLGVEIGFGFQYEGRGGSSVVWDNNETSLESDSNEVGNSANFQWGPNYQGTIRLGYCLKSKTKKE